jgi:cobalt-zinc-cadmium efflux system protein
LDPLASVLIGLLILWNAWLILKETLEILLESVPRDIDMGLMVRDLLLVPGVRSIHDLHVWSLSKSLRMLSAHVVTDDQRIGDATRILAELKTVLGARYGIVHSTLQLECVGCDPDHLYCDLAASSLPDLHGGSAHADHDSHGGCPVSVDVFETATKSASLAADDAPLRP